MLMLGCKGLKKKRKRLWYHQRESGTMDKIQQTVQEFLRRMRVG